MPALTAIPPELEAFIKAQHIFFVATAPSEGGHINLSPKGLDTLRILSPTRVAYLDLTGSGNETAAHVGQNGRITLMFCAFEGGPGILRIYGRGLVVLPVDAEWAQLASAFPTLPGTRQIVLVEVQRVSRSCGFGVPTMSFEGHRPDMHAWAEKKGQAGLAEYREKKNRVSIDGIAVRGW
jgi:Pyridoxamine 5'-phosphate oxidase